MEDFHTAYTTYKSALTQLKSLQKIHQQSALEQEFLLFQQSKMKDITFTKEQIQTAETLLKDSEQFLEKKQSIHAAIELLAGEHSALTYLDDAEKHLRILGISERISPIFSSITSIVEDLEKQKPQNLENVEHSKSFLQKIRGLTREFSVISPEDLLEKKKNIDKKIEDFSQREIEIKDMSTKVDHLKNIAIEKAENLSIERKKSASAFATHVQKKCQEMGIPPAQFLIQFEKLDTIGLSNLGLERVDFYFSANKNQEPKKLGEIASGGEIARIMLALKHFWPSKSTMIFDEIDTGVSGAIAGKMADEMKSLSTTRQIIAITHLPQIAAKADHHFVVEKKHLENSTVTTLRKVDGEERVEMIAKMLAGEEITKEALKAAQKLLS